MNSNSITDTFSRLRSRLRSMATSILQNEDDADDALQDAFCKLWVHRDDEDADNCDGRAVVAVRRVCLDYLRKRDTRAGEAIDEKSMAIGDTSGSLWQESEMDDLRSGLISKLPSLQRRVFEMASEGMENDIIALRLNINEVAVRQNLCRARKALRTEYNKLIANR